MECPACDNGPTRMTVGSITVDACEGGSGGIRFDRYEPMRVDARSAGEGLPEIGRDPRRWTRTSARSTTTRR